jgi:signal transduction histidine kinase
LRRRAEQIEVGNYDVTFDTDRPDEFGDLNRTLATTRDTLRRRFEELRETKVALEETNAALEDRSAMVSVLNRVLRHNVRNDVNVIAGRAEHVAQRVEDESVRAEIEKIQQVAWELAALSNRTQRINHLLSEERTEQTTTDVVGRLRDAVESIRSSAPDAEVDLTVVDVTATRVDCVATLPAAITDAVEQIIDYNDGHVRVEITADGDTAEDGTGSLLIVIADDGRGLPDLDVRAVTRGEETPLDHAQGLALWSLEWTVNKSDGELLVDTDDATIEIRLPLTDAPRRQRP